MSKRAVSFVVYDGSDDFGGRQDMLPTLMAMLRDMEANN